MVQPEANEIPSWILISLLSLLFGSFIGFFVWVVNRILGQTDDNQKQNQANFTRLTDAVVSIERTTAVQAEMLKNHADDIKAHDEILKVLVKSTRIK
jgi:uncharacterized Tic20 family protein